MNLQELVLNPLFLTFYGFLIYFLFDLSRNLDVHQNKKYKRKKYTIKSFLSNRWDNLLLGFALIPLWTYYAPEILSVYNEWNESELTFYSIYYFILGLSHESVYRLIKKISQKSNTDDS